MPADILAAQSGITSKMRLICSRNCLIPNADCSRDSAARRALWSMIQYKCFEVVVSLSALSTAAAARIQQQLIDFESKLIYTRPFQQQCPQTQSFTTTSPSASLAAEKLSSEYCDAYIDSLIWTVKCSWTNQLIGCSWRMLVLTSRRDVINTLIPGQRPARSSSSRASPALEAFLLLSTKASSSLRLVNSQLSCETRLTPLTAYPSPSFPLSRPRQVWRQDEWG